MIKIISVAGHPDLLQYKSQTSRKQYDIKEVHESEYDHQMKLLKRDSAMRMQMKKLKPLEDIDDSLIQKTAKRPLLFLRNGTPSIQASRSIKFSKSVLTESYISQMQFFKKRKCVYSYMILKLGNQNIKLIFELYNDIAPKACENFIQFCQGVKIDGRFYTYKNTQFLRVKQNGFLQGGSFDNKISIYGESFEDESYSIKHNVEGILGLANDGFPHTNTSQFYITMVPLVWFDHKKVAFGKVVQGFKNFQKVLKQYLAEDPTKTITIVDCGKYDHEKITKWKLEQQIDDFECQTNPKALTYGKFVEQEQLKHNEAQGELTSLIKLIVEQIKLVNKYAYQLESAERACKQLEDAFQLQQFACSLYLVDNNQFIQLGNYGKYIVAINAIDGDDAFRGSGFVIFKKMTTQFRQVSQFDFQQSGQSVVAVGYFVHGKTSQFVLGTGYNLTLFTLLDDYRLQQQEMKIPTVDTFICSDLEAETPLPILKERYTSSIFTTLHRVVRLGGIAMYKSVSIFDAIIVAFIVSRSWGMTFCAGTTTFNQIKIKQLTQQTYLYFGQQRWIQKIENKHLSIT